MRRLEKYLMDPKRAKGTQSASVFDDLPRKLYTMLLGGEPPNRRYVSHC